MANIFSGKSEKQIPKSLSECTHADFTAANLHYWSEKIEAWGQILFWILIVCGTCIAIISSIVTKEVDYTYWTKTEKSFDFILFFTSIVETCLYVFLEYCAFHILALLISALASITQSTIISANVALYEASQNCLDPDSSSATTPSKPIFRDKPTDSNNQITNRTVTPDDTWACKNCGTSNSTNYGQCKKCGKFKS